MRKYSLLFMLCIYLKPCYSQIAPYLSLDTLLIQIENNYPLIVQYQYSIQALEARAEGSRSWMPPTFSAGFMRFPYMLENVKMKNDPMNQAGIGFSLEQMLPNKSKLDAKSGYLNSLAAIQRSKSDWTKNEFNREAKILYYYRFINERKQEVVNENKELLDLLITTSEAKFSTNQSQLQSIYKAKARLAELNNMEYMLRSMIAESNIGLNILMVQDPNSSFEIDSLISPKNYVLTLNDTVGISSRSDILVMSKSIESMQLEQEIMKVGNRPDFGIRAEHMQMFGMPNQWSIMGMMTIPAPWSTKMYTSETKAMGFQIQAMELEKQTMELMVKRMTAEKLSMLSYETQQYENFQNSILPAFENNLQANLVAYKQNTGDFFVLIDAWEMLLMKQMEMYDILFKILKLEAEYEYEKEIK